MTTPIRTLSIRTVLLADAGITGVTGLLMLLGAGPLADLLDLPTALLRGAGLVLFPYVAYLVWLSTREKTPHQAVWPVVAANFAWAAGCVAVLLSGQVEPNGLGVAFILVQAVAVLIFADLQVVALRGNQPDRVKNAFTLEV